MVYSDYKKQPITQLRLGYKYKSPLIASEDALPGTPATFTQMCASVSTGTISRKPGTGVKSKITSAVKTIVEQQMQLDDEKLYMHVKSFKRYLKIQIVKPYLKSFKRNCFAVRMFP